MKVKYIIVLSVLILFSGCQKYLELKPRNTLVVNNLKEVELMMSSYLFSITRDEYNLVKYNGSNIVWPFNRDLIAHFQFYSDDVNMLSVLGNSYSKKYEKEYFEDKDWKGELMANTIWERLYFHIGYFTSVITEAEKFSKEPGFAKVAGEALTLRAYFLFKLQQYFAPLDRMELGVPLNLDLDQFQDIKRRTQSEVYQLIIADLKRALELGGREASWNVFNNENIIHHILAQVYMYKAASIAKETTDWENVAIHSDAIVKKFPLEQSETELYGVTRTNSNGFAKNSKFNLLTIGWMLSPQGNIYSLWGFGNTLVPNVDLLNLYAGDDIRKNTFFDTKGNFNKYTFSFDYVYDYQVLFRTTDAHLLAIEAQWNNGDKNGAITKLESFVATRSKTSVGIDEASFYTRLMNERRKEFCAEMDSRWIDMKRNHMPVERIAFDDDGKLTENYKLSKDDFRYTLPIPLKSELSYNGKIEQNPGW